MAKIKNISGFPEWLPEQKLVEDRVINTIKSIYEEHGFTPLETPSVELLSTLTSQGVEDKEIYVLQRAKSEGDKDPEFGMHFDLTVPFARYVAQHFNDIVFPFRRYQCQRSWRGERPQRGRFREFYQFDADIVGRETLPLSCDAEILLIVDKVFSALAIGPFRISVNNRKILLGLYRSLGLTGDQQKQAIVAVDKLDKISAEGVEKELVQTVGLDSKQAQRILEITTISCGVSDFVETAGGIGIDDEEFDAGVNELATIFSLIPSERMKRLTVDLSLARGLGYYSGLIVETRLEEYPEYGSVGGGGRYEGLVSQFLNRSVPGVGVSVGVTRLMDLIFQHNLISSEKRTPTSLLIAVYNEEQRLQCIELAEEARRVGVATEVFQASPKLGKQIDYAAKKGIPYVLFVAEDNKSLQVKDIRTGDQENISSLSDWCMTIG